MAFSKFFKPKNNFHLERMGNDNDGGYLINPKIIFESEYLISFGIFDDWSFEKSLIKKNKNIKVFCYDDLISFQFIIERKIKEIILGLISLKFKNFFKKIYTIFDFIIYKNKLNFNKRVIKENDLNEITEKLNNIFLKVDIEGAEYKILNDIKNVENKLTCLVIEFHDVYENREKIEKFISEFKLKLIHIHPNNYGKVDKNGDPNIIELTFDKRPSIIDNINILPNCHDQKNDPNSDDIKLNFIKD